MKILLGLLIILSVLPAFSQVIDYGPPQDALGHWEFDLYDALGLQRGTSTNPLYFSTSGGAPATSALQTTGNTALTSIQTNTANTASYLSNLGTLATTTNQITGNNYLAQIAANTASALTDTLTTGTITAANGAVIVAAQGAYTISASITGTWVASLIVEGQLADGNWVTLPWAITSYAGSAVAPPYPLYNGTFTANSVLLITSGAYTNVRVRASAYTSGTVAVAFDASIAQQTNFSAQLGNWSIYQSGNWSISPLDGIKNTYSAAITNIAITSSNSTDIFTISGSATKTIRILRVGLTGAQTTSGQRDVTLIKRSTADTGTSVTVASVAHDSTNSAATSVISYYATALPTLGTSVGMIRSARLFFSGSAADSDTYFWEFGTRPGQAIVLRGTAQQLAVNLNGVSAGGTVVSVNVEYTEE